MLLPVISLWLIYHVWGHSMFMFAVCSLANSLNLASQTSLWADIVKRRYCPQLSHLTAELLKSLPGSGASEHLPLWQALSLFQV